MISTKDSYNLDTDLNIQLVLKDLVYYCQTITTKKPDIVSEVFFQYVDTFFQSHNYKTYMEYPITYISKKRQHKGIKEKAGRIDCVVLNNIPVIAIEFDSYNSVKYTSIEKLVQSKIKYCVACVRGVSQEVKTNNKNVDKIFTIITKEFILEKPIEFYYMNVQGKYLQLVYKSL